MVKKKLPTSAYVQEVLILPEFRARPWTIFQPRRKLRPQPKVRTAQCGNIQSCRLFVQIESARNLPFRQQAPRNHSSSRNNNKSTGSAPDNLHSDVESSESETDEDMRKHRHRSVFDDVFRTKQMIFQAFCKK